VFVDIFRCFRKFCSSLIDGSGLVVFEFVYVILRGFRSAGLFGCSWTLFIGLGLFVLH
jgi:hypothetical protein